MFGFLNKIGPLEIVLVLAVILLIFGPTKLPGLAKAVGKSVSELKSGLRSKSSEEAVPSSEEKQS